MDSPLDTPSLTALSPPTESVRSRMQRTGRRDTSAEMAIRRELHARGYRYRVHMPIPGVPRVRPDIVFTRANVVVMIDGCFWHSCPEHGTIPKANRDWWINKLRANRERDMRSDGRLEAAGWTVVRVWEHQPQDVAADEIISYVDAVRPDRIRVPDQRAETSEMDDR